MVAFYHYFVNNSYCTEVGSYVGLCCLMPRCCYVDKYSGFTGYEAASNEDHCLQHLDVHLCCNQVVRISVLYCTVGNCFIVYETHINSSILLSRWLEMEELCCSI